MKTKLLLLFTVSTLCASAQDKGLSVEPLIGYGLTQAVESNSISLGGKIGASFVYMFSDHIGVSAGLQMQQYTSQVSSLTQTQSSYSWADPNDFGGGFTWYTTTTTYTANIKAKYNLTYLEMPLSIRYVSKAGQKVGLFTEAGVVLGFLTYANEYKSGSGITDINTDGYGYPSHTVIPESGGTQANAMAFNFQLHVSAGVVIPVSRRLSFITDISLTQGITNVGNSSNDYINLGGNKLYYYGIGNTNSSVSNIVNYGTDYSWLFNVRLNIKLGSLQAADATSKATAQ